MPRVGVSSVPMTQQRAFPEPIDAHTASAPGESDRFTSARTVRTPTRWIFLVEMIDRQSHVFLQPSKQSENADPVEVFDIPPVVPRSTAKATVRACRDSA